MKPGSGEAAKTFCTLVVAQVACLGLGLWIESQFTRAVAEHALGSTAGALEGDVGSQAALRAISFVWIAGLQTVVAYLVLSRMRTEASRKEYLAADESFRRQNALVRTRNAVIFGLAKLAESRDPETGNHLERIAFYSTQLAKMLRRHPRYHDQVSPSFVKLIGVSSALHDIGKVGVQDSILLKAGKLDEAEMRVMQTHAEIGSRCVRDIELRLGDANFLQMARQIALSHHERWDGNGYPHGLAGEAIPLAARIVAIVDVYDALTSRRVYKEACSHEYSVKLIRDGTGSQFDPDLVDVFLKIQDEFRNIAQRCGDITDPDDAILDPKGTEVPSANDAVLNPLLQASQGPVELPVANTN